MLSHYIVTIFYFAILLLIGYFASKRIKNISDYYVGGKKLNFWVVSFSSRATGESAWLLLGLTGLSATIGVSALWVVLGEVFGVAIAWMFMAKPFKRMSDEYDAITIPDYLVGRFKDNAKLIRTVAALSLGTFVTIYVSAQLDATGQAFETFLHWNDVGWLTNMMGSNGGYYAGVIVGFVIVILYTFSGGFVAVVWSDVFQGIMMLLALVALPIFAISHLSGDGLFSSLGALQTKGVSDGLTEIWGKGGFSWMNLMTVISFFAIGFGFLGSPQMFVRFMSIKNESEIDKGKWVSIGFTILADVGAVLIGLMGRAIFTDVAILGPKAQAVLPLLTNKVFPTVVVSFYIAAVLSAIMSTVDSLLVVASSAISRDFYQKTLNPHKRDESIQGFSRNVTLLLALVALIIAVIVSIVSKDRSIFWFIIFGWSGITATFCPMMIMSIFWKAYNSTGALVSMLTGFFAVPFFKFVAPLIPGVGSSFNKMEELFPAFVLSFVAGIIATKLSSKSK